MKLLTLLLLLPSLSIASCLVNVYDILNGERVYNHSSTGKVVKSGDRVGLRVDTDDINYNSGLLKKYLTEGKVYYTDQAPGKNLFAVYLVEGKNIKRYMIYDSTNSKAYIFFDCIEGTE